MKNEITEISPENPQSQESPSIKFQNQYQSTLNYLLDRNPPREDIIKALPYTLEIIETLADNLKYPEKKIEFKELSKLKTKELREIHTSLKIIDQQRGRPETPTFDAVRIKCTEIIDTLIANKEEAKKNRNSISKVFRKITGLFGRNKSDLSDDSESKIKRNLENIKSILTPPNQQTNDQIDKKLVEIINSDYKKLKKLNAVQAQNSGGNSSGGGPETTAKASLTFDASKEDSKQTPAIQTPAIVASNKPTAVRLTEVPSSIPKLRGKKSLVDKMIEALGSDSPAGEDLQEAAKRFAELREKQKILKEKRFGRNNSNRNGGVEVNR